VPVNLERADEVQPFEQFVESEQIAPLDHRSEDAVERDLGALQSAPLHRVVRMEVVSDPARSDLGGVDRIPGMSAVRRRTVD
jgi:hypothetical protein